ncbi:PREDICTED: aurora kinase A-interacting protein-like [Branchiostoma belcheri]|uniref:Small ribosomal subunit protein mS38 n=1 Tax=Branchiostoma belcheri TaxID=7741 RepID=A0A6P4Z7C2_BRABE|nr:PREDICTED: aurora kinase A-interacting protein-like [Branchiostoma belcheri]XP_019629820.1 PREDICTED: aurora kinase A-interacting protein-like [Branchiostoma belcheri]
MATLLCRRMWQQCTVGRRLMNTAVCSRNVTTHQASSTSILVVPGSSGAAVPRLKRMPSVASLSNKFNKLSEVKVPMISLQKSALVDSMLFTKSTSLTPLECKLTLRYYLPSSKPAIFPEITITDPAVKTEYELPVQRPTSVEDRQPTGAPDFIGDTTNDNVMECRNDLFRRRKKMNKHKLKKLKKRMKFVLRRKRLKKIKKKAVKLKDKIENLYRKFGMTPPDNLEDQCNKVYPTIRC